MDVETLEALAREGVDVEPKPSTIRVIQVGLVHCILSIRSLFLRAFAVVYVHHLTPASLHFTLSLSTWLDVP